MEYVTGTVHDGNTVLFRDVSIELEPNCPPNDPRGFNGVFQVPKDALIISVTGLVS
jgi:hypothetical protein